MDFITSEELMAANEGLLGVRLLSLFMKEREQENFLTLEDERTICKQMLVVLGAGLCKSSAETRNAWCRSGTETAGSRAQAGGHGGSATGQKISRGNA